MKLEWVWEPVFIRDENGYVCVERWQQVLYADGQAIPEQPFPSYNEREKLEDTHPNRDKV